MSLKIEILDYKYTDSNKNVIDWDASVVGELEVTTFDEFPFAMTFQISEFKDITSTSGNYSKTFKFPATKNNNIILKNIYIPNDYSGNKVIEKKHCRISSNGIYSEVGLIKITGIGGYGEIPYSYSGVFYGNNLGWATEIQDSYMNTLVWGTEGEDLKYKKDDIIATWQHEDSDSSSPIVYPITSYGQYNAEGDERTIQLLNNYGTAGGWGAQYTGYYGFTNNGVSYGTPPPTPDWRPALFVKNTLDLIFNSVGYSINSNFMNTVDFKKNVWLLPNFKYNNTDYRTIKYGYGNQFTGEALISSLLIAPTNDLFLPIVWDIFTSVIDLNDAGADFVLNTNRDNTGWDLATGIFTAEEYGEYNITLKNLGLFVNRTTYIGGDLTVDYAKIELQVQTVGHTSWVGVSEIQTGSFFDAGGSSPISEPQIFSGIINHSRYLNKGDKLRLVLIVKARNSTYDGNKITLHLFGSSTPTSSTTSTNSNGNYRIDIDPYNVEYGQTYNLSDVINTEYKQIDFIKGIAHAYNLQMTTDEPNKTINIEPFNTFFLPYKDAVDWTAKLNRGNEITDKWVENDIKRNLIFKYKSDSADVKVKIRAERFFDDLHDEYPYRETLPASFLKGESKFENPFFAGTYNTKDMDTTQTPNVDTAYSACLWTEMVSSNDSGRPNKGFEFLPRLLYWNKYSPNSIHFNKRAQVQTWNSVIKTIVADSNASGSGVLSNIYPQATMYNGDSSSSPNLAYGNVWVRDYDDSTAVYSAKEISKGLYENYYMNMIEMLKRSKRLRTVSINLKIYDVINLDFRKLVYIDGVYWRINKIVDYIPNQNNSTKVELIEWIELGVFAAKAPSFGLSGSTSDWGVGGTMDTSQAAPDSGDGLG